ncbi:efflux RND transporter periplasmic adaptor subunit [Palleronia caenipelagi]|uniref:HlyD family efflux transporter periplasmic adaptor subunit n=1 Tax=Palleronia caenipelagi TaxID=2489174 RepID=A0A547Q7S8_9RHOB|nr:HlyD family efflux transporter periplasmic adaptor subunit [Palleronia caenipelagi]TRD22440.1 HlyD family efflux transporter periplasmic adaptor subunit [Palleronia caenipelagi]
MRFLTRALIGLFLASLTLGLLATGGIVLKSALDERAAREPGGRPPSEQVYAAAVLTLTPETITPVLETFGEVIARRELELRATRAGRLIGIGEGVGEGAQVTAGQLLFELDPADAETDLALARTDLRDAEAELEDAERAVTLAGDDLAAAEAQAELRGRALERQKDLQQRGVGTSAATEEAELLAASARQQVLSRRQSEALALARFNQAKTGLERRRIALREAERTLDDTRITAAFDGVISDMTATEGGLVAQNERLATLLDPDALELEFRVATSDYVRLIDDLGAIAAETALVSLEVGGYTLSSPATITRLAAAVTAGESGRRLYARIETPEGFLPGDFARLSVNEPPLENVVRVPATAVDSAGTVLVLGEEDRLERATVAVLRSQGDDLLIRAPELTGRSIVAERVPRLGPGIKIRPLRQSAAGDPVAEAPEMLDLSPERRAELIAIVEGNARMPEAAKERVLARLKSGDQVPAGMVARIEGGRGG